MKTKVMALITACLMVVAALSLAFAADGNPRKGKFLYSKNCRSCHGDTASDLSPSSFTQAEWAKKFANVEEIPCYGDWPEGLSEQDQKDIYTYLFDFAKDSPTPAKCG
ncbi:MAG: c-type cytochrome [Desulfovibrionales bacterium]